jgi:drug/metabolite transporter (DMT)-like permease
VGIVCIFWRDIAATQADSSAMLGVGLSMLAITMASLGNIMTLKLGKQGLALVPLLSWTMGYGALLLLGIAALGAGGLVWDTRLSYWIALLYLSGFGSVVAFLLYFRLAQRQGPGRAALMGMIIPVIALAISALFENWRPRIPPASLPRADILAA